MRDFERWAVTQEYDLRKIDGVYISPMTRCAKQGWDSAVDHCDKTVKSLVEQLNDALDD